MRFSKTGFTLIELLIVISIMLILMGMTVPQIGKFMERSREQKCRNNLKQLHVGVVNHARDNDNTIMSAQQSSGFANLPQARAGTGVREKGVISAAWLSLLNKSATDSGFNYVYVCNILSEGSGTLYVDLGAGNSARFAVENGGLFAYMNDSLKHYTCPTIAKNTEIKYNGQLQPIYRTYAMSKFFLSGNSVFHSDAAKLMLFSECYPNVPRNLESYVTWRWKNPGLDPFTDSMATSLKSDSDGVIAPDPTVTSIDVNMDVLGYNPHKSNWGVHLRTPGEKAVNRSDVGTVLAVFLDGHIEKLSPVRKIGSSNHNVAWYYVKGEEPPIQ